MWRALSQYLPRQWASAGEEIAVSSASLSTAATSSAAEGSPETSGTTTFGFKDVPEHQKSGLVGEVFKSVASRYDLMNDVMSGGMHRLWKDAFVARIHPFPGMSHLDVAGGTGDIAFRVLNKVEVLEGVKGYDRNLPQGRVVVCDISGEMLEEGKKRATSSFAKERMSWVEGDAEKLPFDENSFDVYTVAFGIRNMTRMDVVLREALRVLKPGGHFLCLEFSRVDNFMLRSLYDTYSFNVIPLMGRLVAGDVGSYQYLVESIRKFPDQATFAAMIRNAGFSKVGHENLMGGIVAIHSGFKLND